MTDHVHDGTGIDCPGCGTSVGTLEPFSFKVSDNRGALYEPWTDGRCVGYKVTFSDGTAEYVYFNPSDMENSPAGESACVFVYQGTTGDVAQDDAVSYFSLLKDGEEWHGLKVHRADSGLPCDHERGWWPCGGDVAKCTQLEDLEPSLHWVRHASASERAVSPVARYACTCGETFADVTQAGQHLQQTAAEALAARPRSGPGSARRPRRGRGGR